MAHTGPITIETKGGSFTSTNHFTIIPVPAPPAPVITQFRPKNGLPGTTVLIEGENLVNLKSVRVGSEKVEFLPFGSDTLFAYPKQGPGGRITIETIGGTVTSQDPFILIHPGSRFFRLLLK